MKKETIILTILLIISVIYAIYTYWPYLPKFKSQKAAAPAAQVVAAAPAGAGSAEAAGKAKAIKPAEIKLVDPFSRRIAVHSKMEQAAAAAAVAAQPSHPESKPVIPKLEGIWVDDAGRRIAFISGQSATVGAQVLGWRVTSILRDRVVIRKGSEYEILKMEGKL